GRLFALYVAGYTLGRFWIEGLRIDPVGGVDHAVELFGLRINQYTALALFIGALVYFWATRNKTGDEVVVSPEADATADADAVPASGDGGGDDPADPAHEADQADDTPGDTSDDGKPDGSDGSDGSDAAPRDVAEEKNAR
ncbi:prolipoprotein diacylglyceryl transferase family protein, partial [Nonomuraea sp. NPDC023979]|uniref:prolipoprotein diacylglyceryl transferase family protein n=1 Tax=Nonomuraea sp. NPDC023979 TaxID=3154796 RepID=UPI00340D4D16